MTMTLTSYCINRKLCGVMDMTFDLVERSRFESGHDYANCSVLHLPNKETEQSSILQND